MASLSCAHPAVLGSPPAKVCETGGLSVDVADSEISCCRTTCPPPSIPTAPAWCPDLTTVLQVLGALEKRFWRPGATRSREIAPDTKVHPPAPPASQPGHLRWCWLVFCDALTPPDQNDHSAACVCRFLRVRFLDLRMGGGGSTLGGHGGAWGAHD